MTAPRPRVRADGWDKVRQSLDQKPTWAGGNASLPILYRYKMCETQHGSATVCSRVDCKQVSAEPGRWEPVPLTPPLRDVEFLRAVGEGVVMIRINRPELHNAFRPLTVLELSRALTAAQDDTSVGVIILTGKVW